jgi:hypothetical protein
MGLEVQANILSRLSRLVTTAMKSFVMQQVKVQLYIEMNPGHLNSP